MDIPLQRVADIVTLLAASMPPDRGDGATGAPRWVVNGCFWLVLLLVPGSFLLLPVLLWWKHRRSQ